MFDINYLDNSLNSNYNIEYIDKGYFKDNINVNDELKLYNHNGNKLSLYIVKITETLYNNSFEIHFIVFENDKTQTDPSYSIDLHIPYGLMLIVWIIKINT